MGRVCGTEQVLWTRVYPYYAKMSTPSSTRKNVIVDLTLFQGRCADCIDHLLAADDDGADSNYATYRKNAAVRFGNSSVPLCKPCWLKREACETCFLPHPNTESPLGQALLRQTTLVTDHGDHECARCLVRKYRDG